MTSHLRLNDLHATQSSSSPSAVKPAQSKRHFDSDSDSDSDSDRRHFDGAADDVRVQDVARLVSLVFPAAYVTTRRAHRRRHRRASSTRRRRGCLPPRPTAVGCRCCRPPSQQRRWRPQATSEQRRRRCRPPSRQRRGRRRAPSEPRRQAMACSLSESLSHRYLLCSKRTPRGAGPPMGYM